MNEAVGADIEPTFFYELGRETLVLERKFNIDAGFTAADDDLPAFFYDEPLAPSAQTARFHGAEVFHIFDDMDGVGATGVPAEYAGAKG